MHVVPTVEMEPRTALDTFEIEPGLDGNPARRQIARSTDALQMRRSPKPFGQVFTDHAALLAVNDYRAGARGIEAWVRHCLLGGLRVGDEAQCRVETDHGGTANRNSSGEDSFAAADVENVTAS